MAEQKKGWVDIDELQRQLNSEGGLERVAAFYGIALAELHRGQREVRTRCFLNCGRTEQSGERALAFNFAWDVTRWKCHHYGCQAGGNLVALCDFLKPGGGQNGKPRGDRFKAIARDLDVIVNGESPPPAPTKQTTAAKPSEELTERNVPLAESPNERARELTNLDAKFIVDVKDMPPAAASYFRKRPFLTPEVCRVWRMGYLARDAGGDRRGGTMRGKIVYPVLAEDGQVLTWFGRDPEYESRHKAWLKSGKQGREPEKVHFVKGFHRGLELFGQDRMSEQDEAAHQKGISLLVVEGPNDVIRMSALGERALGLLSNTISDAQVRKIVTYATDHGAGEVTLLFDADSEGDRGAQSAIWKLAEAGLAVRLAWSRSMHSGAFRERQPESLSTEEWLELRTCAS